MSSNKGLWLGVGLLAGAAAGILLAPQSGRGTRALIRDKSVKLSHDVVDFTDKKTRHLTNKVKGYAHEAKEVLADRVARREGQAQPEEETAGA